MIKLDKIITNGDNVKTLLFRVKPNKQVGWVQCTINSTVVNVGGVDYEVLSATTNKSYEPLINRLGEITKSHNVITLNTLIDTVNILSFDNDDE